MRFARALASLIFNSLSWNDKVNAGATLPDCIACPDNDRDKPANEHRECVMGSFFFVMFVSISYILCLMLL